MISDWQFAVVIVTTRARGSTCDCYQDSNGGRTYTQGPGDLLGRSSRRAQRLPHSAAHIIVGLMSVVTREAYHQRRIF